MSVSQEFVSYVRELLSPIAGITDGSFFGGFAFKSGDKQFAMIMGNTLYFRVCDTNRAKYESLGMEPFSYSTKNGRIEVSKFYSVPETLFEDEEALIIWAREAIQSAYSQPAKRAKSAK